MNMVLLHAKSYIAYFFFIKYLLKTEYINSANCLLKIYIIFPSPIMVINYKSFNIYAKLKVIISCIEVYAYKCLSIFLASL